MYCVLFLQGVAAQFAADRTGTNKLIVCAELRKCKLSHVIFYQGNLLATSLTLLIRTRGG